MSKPTPIHSINLDFSHSDEAKMLLSIIRNRLCPTWLEEELVNSVENKLLEAIELMESLEG